MLLKIESLPSVAIERLKLKHLLRSLLKNKVRRLLAKLKIAFIWISVGRLE